MKKLGRPLGYGWRLPAVPFVSVSQVLENWFGTLQGAEQKRKPSNSQLAIWNLIAFTLPATSAWRAPGLGGIPLEESLVWGAGDTVRYLIIDAGLLG